MKTNDRVKGLVVAGILAALGAGTSGELLACGDKFLVINRGTRFQRAALARQPANILVYAHPASPLSTALARASAEATLSKVGYRPTLVADQQALERALGQGGWDLVVVDLADGPALRGRLAGGAAPMILPVALSATGAELAQARKDYPRVVRGPVKSQVLLQAVDEALALREKLRVPAA
jgi:CheY-like chemotaxis protein